jgi:DNA-binding XRE family transcriptional regulator
MTGFKPSDIDFPFFVAEAMVRMLRAAQIVSSGELASDENIFARTRLLSVDAVCGARNLLGMSKLRSWRKAKKLTQSALAERLGVTVPTVSRIEVGQQWPTPHLMAAIEKVTRGHVSAADILKDYDMDASAAE